ncbi:MAG: YjgP/YjgQ family permease [Bacteroidia bacterium]|nr:LptF/LptG family permease [Bacteroidia bacterium]NNC86632.1 YjgP/YjgQ family permease [Bacteroidia bacterium]NNM16463.1 YjgP/YjgQ family permease [Bacteroidia bacterium]
MKKLHKLTILSFVGPFVATFFIALFVLLMQFLFKYIDDLVGKGLEWYVVAELLMYAVATLVPMALPLAMLVSSIMTFGNLAEKYELVAAKSAGISLLSIMKPLLIIVILISGVAFYFSNTVLPYTNLKMGSLLYDVRQQKPALSLKEGVFYNGIDGFNIRVGEKGDDNQTLKDIMIYDHTSGQGNKIVTVADSGSMKMSDDERYLLISLFDGQRYEEQDKRSNNVNTHPLIRSKFKSDLIRFDLSSFQLNRTNEDLFKDNFQMMNVDQLSTSIDSFSTVYQKRKFEFYKNLKPYYSFIKDSSFYSKVEPAKAFPLTNISKDQMRSITNSAISQTRSIKSYINASSNELSFRERSLARFKIEWHRKFTLSVACFVLFIIGAPLGAIVRKGGLGVPVIISVFFFLVYHIISISGEKFAREGVLEAYQGMWLSTFILLPIGLFLMYKASKDAALLNLDFYIGWFTKIFKLKK